MGKKKDAKMGHRKGSKNPDQGTTVAPTMLNRGHYVVRTLDVFTACGERRMGWHYGTPDDVTCPDCKEQA